MGYKVSLFLLEISVIFLKKLNVWAKSLKCCLKTVCQLFLTMHVSYVVFSFGFVLCTLLSSLFTQGYNSFFFFSLRSRCLILYLLKVKLLSSLFTQYEIALSFNYFSILGMGEILRVRGYIHNILQYHIVIIMLFF